VAGSTFFAVIAEGEKDRRKRPLIQEKFLPIRCDRMVLKNTPVDKSWINFYDADIIHDTKGVNMNKGDLIDALKRKNGFTREKAERVIDLFFGEMTNALSSGDRVEIRGFGSIFVKQYGSYEGRNPKTGESVTVKSKRLPFFRCGKELKERVDNLSN
jgi:integration host factor subunit beta